MTKKNILLDMDGVLSDFLTGALAVLDKTYGAVGTGNSVENYARNYAKFDMNIYYGITMEQFWAPIAATKDFWYNLPAFPWAEQLLTVLRVLGDVTICTAPGNDVSCCAQKQAWLRDVLNIDYRDIVMCNKKYLLANSNTILIDDYDKNAKAFIEAGGHAIVVPSTWNTPNLSSEVVLESIVCSSTILY